MRDHAAVSRRQLRTSNYDAEARAALGQAVENARVAAGYRYRTEFCRAHGIKNLRGLELLEQGRTGVGQAFLFEVADALPNWTRDTPRIVLEGGPVPPVDGEEAPAAAADVVPADWTEEDERRFQLAKSIFNDLGLPMKATALRIMKEEYDRLEAEQVAERNTAGQVTPGERS